jgi:hypothetical protein
VSDMVAVVRSAVWWNAEQVGFENVWTMQNDVIRYSGVLAVLM